MTWEQTAATTAAATTQQVWTALLDGRRWSRWNPGVQWLAVEGAPVTGAVVTIKPVAAPQTAFRVEAAVPERLLALVVTFGPLAALRLRWQLAPDGGGTALAQTVAISGPFAGVLLRRVAQRIASGMPESLARLAACSLEPAP